MVLLATIILPHSSVALDGDPNSESTAVRNRHQRLSGRLKDDLTVVYEGMCAASKAVADLEPDIIVINTAHGISLSDSLGIYFNSVCTGNALWFGEWSEFSATANIDVVRSEELKSFWDQHSIPVQGIRTYIGLDCKLRWAEVVPLLFLQKYVKKETKYIITTDDLKPPTFSVEEWRLNAGKRLAEFLAKIPEKVVVAVCGDLAHFHPTDCPEPVYMPDPSLPLPNYKESVDSSEAYNTALAAWVESKQKSSDPQAQIWDPTAAYEHLVTAFKHDPYTCACFSKGFQMLHGVMAEEASKGAKFAPQIYAHRIPSYFGMIAATFIKK